MKLVQFVVAVTTAVAAGVVLAQSGADVVKAKGCMNCHAVDQKKVGPSFKDIAAKGGDRNAQLAKLKDGKGHPKAAGTDMELKSAIDHIHAQK